MTGKLRYILFIIVYFTAVRLSAQQDQQRFVEEFKRASDLYSEGKYTEAYEAWLTLYNSGQRSAALNFNLGNACFKMNNIPGSILFYERALLLKPADEDINYNLQVARTLVVDKLAEIPDIFLITWFNFLSLSLSGNSWAVISIGSFLLSLTLLSVYFYTARYRLKVLGFWVAVCMFLLSILSLAFSIRNNTLVHHSEKAIVFAPVLNGKSSPDDSGNDLFVLHEGTKVTVEDQVGEWSEIRLSDGNKGWVPSNTITRL